MSACCMYIYAHAHVNICVHTYIYIAICRLLVTHVHGKIEENSRKNLAASKAHATFHDNLVFANVSNFFRVYLSFARVLVLAPSAKLEKSRTKLENIRYIRQNRVCSKNQKSSKTHNKIR